MAKDLKVTVNDLITNKETALIKPENYITPNRFVVRDIIKSLKNRA
jgi:hypothetical protein